MNNPAQMVLFPPRGGQRRGAGRKATGRSTTTHRCRERISRHDVLHVTLRLADGLPTLRCREAARVVRGAVADCARLPGMHATDYSIQANHVHLIVEAEDAAALSKAMRGLTIRLALRLNRLWERTGKVFPNRYHCRRLRSPREVRAALQYVLHNHRGHARRAGRVEAQELDWYSTARGFEAFRGCRPTRHPEDFGCARPRTWLRRVGWQQHGLIDPRGPGAAVRARGSVARLP